MKPRTLSLSVSVCLSLSHQFKVVAEAVLLQHAKTHHVERREDPTTARLLLVRHLALLYHTNRHNTWGAFMLGSTRKYRTTASVCDCSDLGQARLRERTVPNHENKSSSSHFQRLIFSRPFMSRRVRTLLGCIYPALARVPVSATRPCGEREREKKMEHCLYVGILALSSIHGDVVGYTVGPGGKVLLGTAVGAKVFSSFVKKQGRGMRWQPEDANCCYRDALKTAVDSCSIQHLLSFGSVQVRHQLSYRCMRIVDWASSVELYSTNCICRYIQRD